MCDHDQPANINCSQLFLDEVRLLHEIPGGHNDTMEDTSNSTDSSDDGENSGINNLATEFNAKWVLWICLGLLIAYLLYRAHRCLLRRARIVQSEHAMDHLGDLQMLPSEDFSGSDPDYEDGKERESGLL